MGPRPGCTKGPSPRPPYIVGCIQQIACRGNSQTGHVSTARLITSSASAVAVGGAGYDVTKPAVLACHADCHRACRAAGADRTAVDPPPGGIHGGCARSSSVRARDAFRHHRILRVRPGAVGVDDLVVLV